MLTSMPIFGGWKEGWIPFIRVGGCFLKTATQGELLVAIGRNGNNQMFPVAWEVAEGKGNESWKWFLSKLMQDLNHLDGQENFDDQLKILEEMGANSANDMLAIPTNHWGRAYFT
ncbi:hypothetical protein V6N12_045500 [Hibiscus sabdariffa]|uniref:MULE transposase domain-containing protein n=1 Tax=Hibiscus sabdariffa TaxID=183260 RepID=A0ABR2G337_9ROSI